MLWKVSTDHMAKDTQAAWAGIWRAGYAEQLPWLHASARMLPLAQGVCF